MRLKLPWPTKHLHHRHVSARDITNFYYHSIQLRTISRVTEARIRYDLEQCETCRRRYQRAVDILDPMRGRMERVAHNILIKEFRRAARVLIRKEDIEKLAELFLVKELRKTLQAFMKKRKKKK